MTKVVKLANTSPNEPHPLERKVIKYNTLKIASQKIYNAIRDTIIYCCIVGPEFQHPKTVRNF